jgi:hypothetical protein
MAASGEPYSVAARRLAAAEPAGDATAVREVVARAKSTLAAPSARLEFRLDTDIVRPERQGRHRPGPVGKLVRLAARAAWQRIAPGVDAASMRDAFMHQAGKGFLEPAADRYLIDYGSYAEMAIGGKRFGGASGHPLQARHEWHRERAQRDDPLGLLRLLQDVTVARHVGQAAVRGTPCRMVEVRARSAEFTVWIDDEHIRRIESEARASDEHASVSRRETLELWDFGVAVDSLDWSRLPSFQTPG